MKIVVGISGGSGGIYGVALLKVLKEMGIETRPIIAGNLTRHPGFQGLNIKKASSLKNADDVFENGFMIGCHPFDWKDHADRFQRVFKALANEKIHE